MGFIPSIAKLNPWIIKERLTEPPIFPCIWLGMEVRTKFLIAFDKFRYAWQIFLDNDIQFVPNPLIRLCLFCGVSPNSLSSKSHH